MKKVTKDCATDDDWRQVHQAYSSGDMYATWAAINKVGIRCGNAVPTPGERWVGSINYYSRSKYYHYALFQIFAEGSLVLINHPSSSQIARTECSWFYANDTLKLTSMECGTQTSWLTQVVICPYCDRRADPPNIDDCTHTIFNYTRQFPGTRAQGADLICAPEFVDHLLSLAVNAPKYPMTYRHCGCSKEEYWNRLRSTIARQMDPELPLDQQSTEIAWITQVEEYRMAAFFEERKAYRAARVKKRRMERAAMRPGEVRFFQMANAVSQISKTTKN